MTSRRKSPLPKGWRKIRARILERDPTCTLGYDRCTGTSTEVDHVGHRDDHRDSQLRGVCTPCHATRTGRQAAAAKPQRTRPPQGHPGLTDGKPT